MGGGGGGDLRHLFHALIACPVQQVTDQIGQQRTDFVAHLRPDKRGELLILTQNRGRVIFTHERARDSPGVSYIQGIDG